MVSLIKNVKYSIQPELLISTSLSAWVGVEQYQLINTFPINYKIPGSTNSFFFFLMEKTIIIIFYEMGGEHLFHLRNTLLLTQN